MKNGFASSHISTGKTPDSGVPMSNPHKYDDTNKQGAEKIMAWAGIVDGRILPIVWFKPGESVNSQIYLNLLETKLWPAIESDRNVDRYIFQQDGAAPHCSDACLSFLDDKFRERVISRRTER